MGNGLALRYSQHPKTGLDLWAAAAGRRPQAVPGHADPLRRDGGAILPRRAVGGVSVERIQASADLRPTVSWARRPVAGVDGGREPAAVAARREGTVLCRARRPLDGGADRGWSGPTALEAGAPVPLFRTRLASGANINSGGLVSKAQYAVASDGRFLMNMTVEAATAPPITVVLNWDAALKK